MGIGSGRGLGIGFSAFVISSGRRAADLREMIGVERGVGDGLRGVAHGCRRQNAMSGGAMAAVPEAGLEIFLGCAGLEMKGREGCSDVTHKWRD